MRTKFRIVTIVLFAVVAIAGQSAALGPMVSQVGNKHNLSAANTGVTYRATDDPTNNPKGQQICIFCHTPHSANVAGQAPLWNRKFSIQNFQRYSSATLKIRGLVGAQYATGAQPDGSSKLCLSCHDGVSKLGEVYNGFPITMSGADVITGLSSFDPNTTNKMKLGHHPVSFVYTAAIATAINTAKSVVTYQMPVLSQVKLDKQGKMQCSTCHDAHQNQSIETECYGGTCNATFTRKKAPFWTYGLAGTAAADQQAVCTTCHPMDAAVGFTAPWPP
jgi:hypothetical protein